MPFICWEGWGGGWGLRFQTLTASINPPSAAHPFRLRLPVQLPLVAIDKMRSDSDIWHAQACMSEKWVAPLLVPKLYAELSAILALPSVPKRKF